MRRERWEERVFTTDESIPTVDLWYLATRQLGIFGCVIGCLVVDVYA